MNNVLKHGVLERQIWEDADGGLMRVMRTTDHCVVVMRARDLSEIRISKKAPLWTRVFSRFVRGPSLEQHNQSVTPEEEEAWQEKEAEARMDAIGQNGNDGEHYDRQDSADLERAEIEAAKVYDNPAIRRLSDDYAGRLGMAVQPQGIAGGMKWDRNKPRMDLLLTGMPRALEAVGQVLTFGAEKYAAHSWQKVENAEDRYYAAQVRHQLARGRGEDFDEETGLLHLAHEACNVLFRLELELQKRLG